MGTIKEFRQYFTTFALSKHQRCVMIRKLSLSRPSRLLTRIIKLEKNLVGKCGAILDDTGSSIAYCMMGAMQSICDAGTTDKTVFMNTVFTKMSGIQSDGCAIFSERAFAKIPRTSVSFKTKPIRCAQSNRLLVFSLF